MKITSDSVRIETSRHNMEDSGHACIDVTRALYGYGAVLRLGVWSRGVYYLCIRKEDPNNAYLFAASSSLFKDEIRAEGYTIVQKISLPQLIATADHHEKQEHPSTPNPVSTP